MTDPRPDAATTPEQMRRSMSALTAILLTLLALGVVMVASTTAPADFSEGRGPVGLQQHLIKVGVAIVAFLIGVRVRPSWLRRLAPVIYVLSVGLLAAVLVVGVERNHATRWIDLGPIDLQPSELARVAVIVGLAAWASRAGPRMAEPLHGVLLPGMILLLPTLLTLVQPDFGSALYLLFMGVLVLWTGGARTRHLATVFGGALALASIYGFERLAHVSRRLDGFLTPTPDSQVGRGLVALGHGHVTGRGLGAREVFVPEAENDFVLAALGEQLGLIGTLGLLVLYGLFLWHGLRLLMGLRTRFGLVVGAGLLLQVLVQAVLNMAVVTALAPPKGIPLPFVSAGGTSLLVLCFSTGLLLGLARWPAENRAAAEQWASASRRVRLAAGGKP